jgi:hypothetical protein
MGDFDSDSDDDILLTQTFRKPSRAEAKKQATMENVLDEALAESRRQHESLVRIHQIRATQCDSEDDDVMHARIEQITVSIKQEGPSKRHEDALEGFDDALPRERRVALQKAMDADLSSRLGARKGIIQFEARRGGLQVYSSQEDAIQDLQRVLKNSKHPVYQSLLKAAEFGILSEFLASERLVENLQSIDDDVSDWLCRVSFCAGLGDMGLVADAATKTLLSLRGKAVFTKIISVPDFLGLLQCWVDLDKVTEATKEDVAKESPSTTNIRGLVNCLLLWETSISYAPSDAAAATKCIAALVRLGLDDSVDPRVRGVIQRVLASILDLVSQQHSDDEQTVWIKSTVKEALEGLHELGPGAEGAEDFDDKGAWLCLSAAVRLVPSATTRGSCSRAVHRFKAALALQAVEVLLVDETDECNTIEAYVERVLHETGQGLLAELASSSMPWLVITAAYAGLVEIEMQGKDIANDPPKCLATIECLFMACEAGMLLLDTDTTATVGAEYGSIANAKAFVTFLEVFDVICAQLSGRTMTNLATNSHFRRADMELMLFHSHNFVMKKRAEHLAATAQAEVKQAKVTSFFAPKSANKTALPIGG